MITDKEAKEVSETPTDAQVETGSQTNTLFNVTFDVCVKLHALYKK